ncbi:MAG: FmdB family transcriptional regulator [Gammaproteobacteria bacterium]|nr:MAG: FmdB family transcriptional regulator [Gammaproteobacteria bacterium]
MPIYDYHCASCGSFSSLQALSAYDQPCACPVCHSPCDRVFLEAPSLALMSDSRRRACTTNERARHEPRRATGQHPPGCACCSAGQGSRRAGTHVREDGVKSFPASRPWQISH